MLDVQIIGRRALVEAWTKHSGAEPTLRAWYAVASKAKWKRWSDVRATFPTSDRVGDRIVFDIRGGSFRLIVGFHFPTQILFVKWFGTHAEYNKIDVATVRYTK